jgi:hypothetical protein
MSRPGDVKIIFGRCMYERGSSIWKGKESDEGVRDGNLSSEIGGRRRVTWTGTKNMQDTQTAVWLQTHLPSEREHTEVSRGLSKVGSRSGVARA